jgi:hypothetical protein
VAIAAQAAKELAQSIQVDVDGFIDVDVFVIEEDAGEEGGTVGEFLASDTIAVDVAVGAKGERTRL